MPRKKRSSSPFDLFDEVFDDDSSSKSGNPPRNAANARERARMRVLSSAFGRLKTKLPNIPVDTKLSKLDTLRLATIYIKQLKMLVDNGQASVGENMDSSFSDDGDMLLNKSRIGSQNITWPFALHHIQNSSRPITVSATNWNNNQQDSIYKLSYGQTDEVFQQGQYHSNLGHWYRDDSRNGADCAYSELIQTPIHQEVLQYTSQQFGPIQ